MTKFTYENTASRGFASSDTTANLSRQLNEMAEQRWFFEGLAQPRDFAMPNRPQIDDSYWRQLSLTATKNECVYNFDGKEGQTVQV